MKYAGWGLMLSMLLASQPAWASRLPIHDAAESPDYGRKAGGMLGRGLLNAATFFVDLPVDIANETRNGPPLIGTLVGVGKGLGCSTLRLLSGGVDLITFWVPGFNGIPVSASYDNCLATDESSEASEPRLPSEMAPSRQTGWTEPSMSAPAQTPSAPAPVREEKPRYTK